MVTKVAAPLLKRMSEPKPSDHFNGKTFFVSWPTDAIAQAGVKELLKWKTSKENIAWPKDVTKGFVLKQRPPQTEKNFVQFINHSTVLMDVDGLRIITDPHFGKRASPSRIVGPKRHHSTPFSLEELGRLDVVLLSHNHYDHFDADTLQKLQCLYQPKFIVPHSNGPYLLQLGVHAEQITELDWWETAEVQNAKISVVPAQHWSKRTFKDRNFALWGGFVIENAQTKKIIYFAGDSGYGSLFKQIHKRWPKFDLAFIPVGAYEPRWIMTPQHMNPPEAVQTHLDVGAVRSIGIHHSCFKLTDEEWDAPKKDLAKALRDQKLAPDVFVYPRAGEIFNQDFY